METQDEQSTTELLGEALWAGPKGWWDIWCATLVWLHLAPGYPEPTGWAVADLVAEDRWHRRVYWSGVLWAVNLGLAVALLVVAF